MQVLSTPILGSQHWHRFMHHLSNFIDIEKHKLDKARLVIV
jgi:hypothetical protein